MTSLVGHSGSGKSTILNLIPRFYDAQSGDIKIDDQSLYKGTIKSLRKEISMVNQETTLFDDTIINNIKYANENASDQEIYEVSKLSYCDEFIKNLPKNTKLWLEKMVLDLWVKNKDYPYKSNVKKKFNNFTRWSTSSLDSETENKIQEALKVLTKNKTTIVIAHRLSTILNSNNIYVIDYGNVVDNGKHEDLIKKSELYRSFYEKQIQK